MHMPVHTFTIQYLCTFTADTSSVTRQQNECIMFKQHFGTGRSSVFHQYTI